ncbi:MAG TPA: response regulator [Deltaproteobacteria bacterium]|nr:response regulator [Deltaproteobacteria bacterium]HIJ76099.1 response regulator [Deltaproteobacteria bacterium]
MSTKTVLVVDDDRISREQLEKELKRNFFRTFVAPDGRTALQIVAEQPIDILVVDVNLPDMNGIKVLELTKARRPGCEAVVITGYGNQEIAIEALRTGAIDYIEKPVDPEELRAALGRAQERLIDRESLSYVNTLLVIDDEELVVKTLKEFLRKEGYEVFGALSGRAGLEIIEHHKVDVLITDVNMAGMDGIEVLQRAKHLYQDIEGILVTGHKDEQFAIRAVRAEAFDYISKPIDLNVLLFSIKKAIERIGLNRSRLYRNRELKLTAEIISKMNEELERRIEERSRELNLTQAQLFQTSKLASLGEMSAGLAHEMNQPLGGISLVAKNMRKLEERGLLTAEEIDSALNDIEASVVRMSKIIKHIRTFARQDTLSYIQVDVNETIDSALGLLGEQLRLHGIEVALELDRDLPKVTGEPYQLEQVWINLITNARDAMEEKEKQIAEGALQASGYTKLLTISSSLNSKPGKDGIVIHFHDNGSGITDEDKDKIFHPFFTTKEVGRATGLGLSISYGIVQKHNGSIEIVSKAGEGTTISVLVPTGD